MTIVDLKAALAAILAEEDRAEPDWNRVRLLSEWAYVRLTTAADKLNDYPHTDVVDYLAGYYRRQLDNEFGDARRAWLRHYLGSGNPRVPPDRPA